MPEFKNLEFLKARFEDARARAAAATDVMEKAAYLRMAESFEQLLLALEKCRARSKSDAAASRPPRFKPRRY